MAKKEIFKQYLSDVPVLIEDRSLTSPNYFRITKLPSQLTAGKNTIKFTLNTPLFANESIIYVEILDYNQDPIYYEVNIDKESSNNPAIINIFVNQDTCPGNGQIILCSTINKTIDGISLDTSSANIRWIAPINIDISKRNDDSIIFTQTPEALVTSNYAQVNETNYIDLNVGGSAKTKEQTQTVQLTGGLLPVATYYNHNNTPIVILNEYAYTNPVGPQRGFVTSSVNASINISSSYINELIPTSYENINVQQFSSSIKTFTGSLNFIQSFASPGTGSHIAYLKNPISYPIVDSNERYYPDEVELSDVDVTYTLSPNNDNLYTFKNATQNTYNLVTVDFKNLTTTTGTIAKIRSYYKSSGLGEYILFNESSISELDAEFGFNTDSLVATYTVPTIHKNEKIDFKFEFISLSGFVASETVEVQNTTFVGGNTYIGGDDNLITGSLFVASSTGSGVQISGKNNSAMIRSIGYEGFAKAKAGTSKAGFVIYSGSIQPILNSSEVYSGVGIELYANTSSYFKYTTSGSGLLDVRTDSFFLGSNRQFISGANGNIEISSSNFHLSPNGNVNMSGDINANTGIFKDVNIIGTIATCHDSIDDAYAPLPFPLLNSGEPPNYPNYLLEAWVTASAYIGPAQSEHSKIPITFTAAGNDLYGKQMLKFKTGKWFWTGSIVNYTYDYETNTSIPESSLSFTSSISAMTASAFSANTDLNGWPFPNTYDEVALGDVTGQLPYSGFPTTFTKWGRLVGYGTRGTDYNGTLLGNEYGYEPRGGFPYYTYITGSVDSVIFNVVTGSVPYTVSILSEVLYIDNLNIYQNLDQIVSAQVQMQARFINSEANWLYSYKTVGGQTVYGPKMYDCKFTIDIYNGNDELLVSDSRMQEFDYEWMDFNIPITALLLKNKTKITVGVGFEYVANRVRIKLSWQLIKHTPPLGYNIGPAPQQIRLTELRIVDVPTAIGLRVSSINFSDSYLSSMNNGTAVEGNLIPVDDSLYDLGSSDQEPLLSDTLINFTTTSTQKRWNNIYGKFLSVDNGISIGSGVVIGKTGSLAQGSSTIAAGKYSHAEGLGTITGREVEVINKWADQYYEDDWGVQSGEYWTEPTTYGYTANPVNNNSSIRTLGINPPLGSDFYEGGPGEVAVALPDPYLRDTVICTLYESTSSYYPGDPDLYYFDKYVLKYLDNNNVLAPYDKLIRSIIVPSGHGAHAEGWGTSATGYAAHAEGGGTIAAGSYSHAEGKNTKAIGEASHAEGQQTIAQGDYSHAEGEVTEALGDYSHTEGWLTVAPGKYSHAEGWYTNTSGNASHAEGYGTVASGNYSHAEGYFTLASGTYSHAEGLGTSAIGSGSHAEGSGSTASADYSHAEGRNTTAQGQASHTEGYGPKTGTTKAYLANSVASGVITLSSSYGNITGSFLPLNYLWIDTDPYDGVTNSVIHQVSTSQYTAPNTLITVSDLTFNLINDGLVINTSTLPSTWAGNITTAGDYAHAEGSGSIAIGNASHAEGLLAMSFGGYSHAEGYYTKALRGYSHAEGREAIAAGRYSHAEGISTQAQGTNSHAEGDSTKAVGNSSHAEGQQTIASGDFSHAEGKGTTAAANHSHAEGLVTQAIAGSDHSHVEGWKTIAAGKYQHVQGQFNVQSTVQSAFILGAGIANNARSNLIFAAGSEVQITGSLMVKDILQLAVRTTTPTGVEGMIIASGSVGDSKLYYYNGTTWNTLF